MDAVEYLKQLKRMCNSKGCNECPLRTNNDAVRPCVPYEFKDEKMAVEIVEKWAKEHPVKTRQSILLDFFPNARMTNGVVNVYPCTIDPLVECNGGDCDQCRRKYWTEEIE